MRDYTVKHAIVLVLSLLAASAESLAIASAPPGPRTRTRMQRVAVVSGTLPGGAVGTHHLPFTRGREHRVVAACENACGDMSLRLFSPAGIEIDRNTTPAPLPEVGTVPAGTGSYRIDVTMARCASRTCGYSLIVLAR